MDDTTNLCLVLLESIGGSTLDLERVLDPMGEAIRECEESVRRTVNPEAGEAVASEEYGIIDEFLGAALVLCQAEVAAVTSNVSALHKYLIKQRQEDAVATVPGAQSKDAILHFGSLLLRGSAYSQVQAINALANYFKHREEWPAVISWDDLPKEVQKRTARVIKAAGAQEGALYNLERGAKTLGCEAPHDLEVFARIITDWRQELHRAYEAKLRAGGLI